MNMSKNLYNGKPYRTKEQKALARKTARKDKDGAWRSDAPLSWHSKAKKNNE